MSMDWNSKFDDLICDRCKKSMKKCNVKGCMKLHCHSSYCDNEHSFPFNEVQQKEE